MYRQYGWRCRHLSDQVSLTRYIITKTTYRTRGGEPLHPHNAAQEVHLVEDLRGNRKHTVQGVHRLVNA